MFTLVKQPAADLAAAYASGSYTTIPYRRVPNPATGNTVVDNNNDPSSSSKSGKDDGAVWESRALAAEQKLAEVESRLRMLEEDYQVAVSYVKSTEKMMRRMKDELNSQRSLNQRLQEDLDRALGRASVEATPRKPAAGGDASDDLGSALRLATENEDLHRRMESMDLELNNMRSSLLASQWQAEERLRQVKSLERENERLLGNRKSDVVRDRRLPDIPDGANQLSPEADGIALGNPSRQRDYHNRPLQQPTENEGTSKPQQQPCVTDQPEVTQSTAVRRDPGVVDALEEGASTTIERQASPRRTYPWSTVRLLLRPPVFSSDVSASGTTPSPSPFPRYGHSLPATATPAGDLLVFGGLVKEKVCNDLYSISTRSWSTAQLQTAHDVPSGRVGHSSARFNNVLVVWGGDTITEGSNEPLDDGLYLLNLGTREWTKVENYGPAPKGRYGQAVSFVGTKFYVFGGQADLLFLNDLWAFDLSTLRNPRDARWEKVKADSEHEGPARRTGHVLVTFEDRIYMFGGTDGQYHYNDTWCFNTSTLQWSELTCIGFIPPAREGHAAAIVEDVMYVFGGRGVDGKDFGDLSAFKISNHRWYTFQKMGPAPTPRSGHAMASVGKDVFVLGGESSVSRSTDDAALVHVLDTRHIKYPEQ